MSILSHAFGRVTLTDRDAEKFLRQVQFGRPKAAAVEGVKRGVEMSQAFRDRGFVKVNARAPKAAK